MKVDSITKCLKWWYRLDYTTPEELRYLCRLIDLRQAVMDTGQDADHEAAMCDCAYRVARVP